MVQVTLQEIHSLSNKITDGLNSVGNYRQNIDGTRHIIFSTFFLPFTDEIPIKIYRRKCSVGNLTFRYHLPIEYLREINDGSVPYVIFARQLLGTISQRNTYGTLPTEVFRR